jgi:hypothetical protein
VAGLGAVEQDGSPALPIGHCLAPGVPPRRTQPLLSMISAQRYAFVARENRYTFFRVMP